MKIDWIDQDLPPRSGAARELSRRTIEFSHPVKPFDLVRIVPTAENVIVRRPRLRGGGWVCWRGVGSIRRTPFGEAEAVTITHGVVPAGVGVVEIITDAPA